MTQLVEAEPANPPTADDDSWALVSRLNTLFTSARDRKRKMLSIWRRNFLLVHNRMWTDSRTNGWMPSPTDSEMYPILSSVVAWLTDQEVSFSASAAADPHSPTANWWGGVANDLQTVMESNWHTEHWDMEAAIAIWDSLMYGAGVLKTVWDPAAVEGLGNARLIRVDPWCFYPDPQGKNDDDCEYFVEVHTMSFGEAERRYPSAAHHLWANHERILNSGSNDLDIPPDLWQTGRRPVANIVYLPKPPTTVGAYGLPGQSRISALVDVGITVKEFWVKENRPHHVEETNPSIEQPSEVMVAEWRVIVVAGNDVILMDAYASDLWGSARHPYVRQPFDDLGIDYWGMPLASHLAHPQIAINRLLSTIQMNAELTGNPIFLDQAGSGLDRTAIINRPGLRLTMQAAAGNSANPPSWLTPPSMPQYISATIDWWIQRMENISGISAPSKGASPPPRTPASSVTATQESGFVRIRNAMRNRQNALSTAGELLAQLVIENYTTPRIVSIVGDSGDQTSLALAGRHFYSPDSMGATPLRFALMVDAGANNPTSRSSRISEADTLFAMGAIDRQAVLEAHNYPNAQSIAQRMAQAEAAAAAAGLKPGAPGKRVKANRTS